MNCSHRFTYYTLKDKFFFIGLPIAYNKEEVLVCVKCGIIVRKNDTK